MNIERILKMKNKKMVLGIALMVMAIIPVYAQQYNSESDFQIDWDNNVNNGIVITKYTGTRKEVSIPPSIQNNPVTGIWEAFSGNRNITSVTIPASVTSIGSSAFGGCTSLASITIPSSVTSIGDYAFAGTGLTSVTIPSSVTSIGKGAFAGCSSLTSLTIGNGVTSIWSAAFLGCTSLTSVTIPNSITRIYGGDIGGAFEGCSKLTSVTIGNGVTGTGYKAFQGCTSLASITIPSSVTTIDGSAFAGCSSLTSITIPSSVTSIGNMAFAGTGLTSVTIPSSVTTIWENAFAACSSLTSITIEGNITTFASPTYGGGLTAFQGDLVKKYQASDGGPGTYTRFANGQTWRKTQSITPPTPQPAAATSAAEPFVFEFLNEDKAHYVLARSTAQGAVVIPDTYNNLPVIFIANNAFQSNAGLASVTIPAGITFIGKNAFVGCDNLTSVTFQRATMNSMNFERSAFPGDLRAKYLAKKGGAGTYTRPNGASTTWTKVTSDAAAPPASRGR